MAAIRQLPDRVLLLISDIAASTGKPSERAIVGVARNLLLDESTAVLDEFT
jgi:hypothetical protein